MNCEKARELLSAYFDGELNDVTGESQNEVRDHIAGCEACAKELRSFEQLRQLAAAEIAQHLAPPSWELIAVRLSEIGNTAFAAGSDDTSTQAVKPVANHLPYESNRRYALGGLLTLAASALLFLGLRAPQHHEEPSVTQASVATLNLQPFMELFSTDADKAMATLASQLPTVDVSLANVEAEFGRPTFIQTSVSSNSLPGNAQLVSTKLLQFPYCKCPRGACTCGPGGCTCVACLCERPDGSTYLVLELCKSQSITFGDLPVQFVRRGDRHLQQVEVKGTVAISWEQGGERLTAIGIRGPQEIDSLLANN